MSHNESAEAAPQAVSRWGLYLPTTFLFLLGAGWSGFWFYAANLTDRHLTQWVATEKAAGRHFECQDQKISGFPFRIELICASARLTTPNLRVDLGAIHTATQIYNPKLALVDVNGPLRIKSAGVTTLVAWNNMRISMRFGQSLERLSIVTSDLVIGELQKDQGLSAKSAEIHLRTDTARSHEEGAIDFAIRLQETRISSLDPLFGNQDLNFLELNGTATNMLNLRATAWQTALETWRAANGRLILEKGRMGRGHFLIEGQGTLDIDPSHRLRGELNVSVKGAAPLVSRLIPGNAAMLASALLERKDGTPTQLPLRLQDGRLSLGPLRSGPILSPLY